MALVELLFNGPKWASNILKALGVLGISSLFSRSEYSIILFFFSAWEFFCLLFPSYHHQTFGKTITENLVIRFELFGVESFERILERWEFSQVIKKTSSNLKEMDSLWLNTFFWGFIFARQWTSDQNMRMSSLLSTPSTSPKSSF